MKVTELLFYLVLGTANAVVWGSINIWLGLLVLQCSWIYFLIGEELFK